MAVTAFKAAVEAVVNAWERLPLDQRAGLMPPDEVVRLHIPETDTAPTDAKMQEILHRLKMVEDAVFAHRAGQPSWG